MEWSGVVRGVAVMLLVVSPLTAIGMVYDDGTYWLVYDVFVLVFAPAAGLVVLAAWRSRGPGRG